MIMKNKMTDVALKYLQMGFNVFPVGSHKKPLIKWEKYQTISATKEEIIQWFEIDFPDAQIGIVTGVISDLVVIDVEKGGRIDDLPKTVTARSGGGGIHYYFKEPKAKLIRNSSRTFHLVDIRGEGGYVVAPPSLHLSGGHYEWASSPEDTEIAELPEWVIDKIEKKTSEKKIDEQFKKLLSVGVNEGSRNDMAAKIVGTLLRQFQKNLWENDVWSRLKKWNLLNKPPLDETELRKVFESISKNEDKKISEPSAALQTDEDGDGKSSKAHKVMEILYDETPCKVFKNTVDGEVYAAIHGNGTKIFQLRSREFRDWINHVYYKKTNATIGKETIDVVCSLLRMEAVDEHALFVRVAYDAEGNYWYDLGSAAVKFNSIGWSVVLEPPIMFKRFTHQKNQVAPEPGGDLSQFLNLVNLKTNVDKIIFQVYLLAAFLPGFSHPVMGLFGVQGSAKSTASGLVKEILDPSKLKTLAPFKDTRQFTQAISHHWVAFFDNLSTLNEELSDAICRACTGEGSSKRVLYSDDDDFIYNFQHVIGLNGISNVASKPDLLDRLILIELERIPQNQRKMENEIRDEFEKIKPKILGACFSALSKAIDLKPTVKPKLLLRMAEWTVWGCAIAEALGIKQEEFIDACSTKQEAQNKEALDASVIGRVVIKMVNNAPGNYVEDAPTALLKRLKDTAELMGLSPEQDKHWPKKPNWLLRRLKDISVNLESIGISCKDTKGDDRKIIIQKTLPFNITNVTAHHNDGSELSDIQHPEVNL